MSEENKIIDILITEKLNFLAELPCDKTNSMFYALIHYEDYHKLLSETKNIKFSEGKPSIFQDIYLIKTKDIKVGNIKIFK